MAPSGVVNRLSPALQHHDGHHKSSIPSKNTAAAAGPLSQTTPTVSSSSSSETSPPTSLPPVDSSTGSKPRLQEAFDGRNNAANGRQSNAHCDRSASGTCDTRRPDFSSTRHDRLKSFARWPSTAPVLKESLANAGFYYLGSDLETACGSCNVIVSDWNARDDASEKHRLRSPDCEFMLQGRVPGVSRDVSPTEFGELMKSPQQRIGTFASWPRRDIDIRRLAYAGFYYVNEGDKVRCPYCKGVLERWQPDDDPFEEHSREFPCCPFVLNPPEYLYLDEDGRMISSKQDLRTAGDGGGGGGGVSETGRSMQIGESTSLRSPTSSSPARPLNVLHAGGGGGGGGGGDDVVVSHSGPKHPDMRSIEKRRATFATSAWPAADTPVDVEDLVEAGFFFLGVHDFTKCFHCDGGLCSWQRGDDPWTEHARWSPHCTFVQLSKGSDFIRRCRRRHNALLTNAANVVAASASIALGVAAAGPAEASSQQHLTDDRAHAPSGQGAANDANLPERLCVELEAVMASSAVKAYLSMGVPKAVVRMTVKKFMLDKGRGFRSYNEMSLVVSRVCSFGVVAVETATAAAKQPSRNTQKPKEIPETVLCRVCMVKMRSVVFTPCGHCVTCASCAASVTECVVCRKSIVTSVRVLLA